MILTEFNVTKFYFCNPKQAIVLLSYGATFNNDSAISLSF